MCRSQIIQSQLNRERQKLNLIDELDRDQSRKRVEFCHQEANCLQMSLEIVDILQSPLISTSTPSALACNFEY